VIDFKKRSVIKSQILADFISEWMEPSSQTKVVIPKSPWIVFYDGDGVMLVKLQY
jgi:hypothetical protein